MAISYIGGTSADTTTTSLPVGAQTGDLAIVVTARNNVSGSGIPLGWNDLGVISGGSGGTAHGQRVGWKLLEAADITAADVGQWATAKTTQVLVYRAASGVSDDTSGTGASGNTITFPARSSLSSGSWVVAVGTHRSASDVDDIAATDYTNRSAAFTATSSGGMDTNGAVASVVERTATVNASSGNVGRTMEVEEAAAPPAITGTVATTTAVATVSATGSLTFEGTAGTTTAAATAAASGSLIFAAVAATTTAPAEVSASGKETFIGSVATETPMATVSATGEVEISGFEGTVATTTAPATVEAFGAQSFIGTAATETAPATVAAEGLVVFDGFAGTVATTSQPAQVSATGFVSGIVESPSLGGSGGGGGWGNRYTLVPIHWPAPIDDDDEIPSINGSAVLISPKARVNAVGIVKNPQPITGSVATQTQHAKAEVTAAYKLRIVGHADLKFSNRRQMILADDELMVTILCGKK